MPNILRRLKTILGMNSYDDPTTLPEGIVRLVQNMLPRKTSLDTREGWSKYNSTVLPSSSGVFGNALYLPSLNNPIELAVSNGRLYSGESGTFTERYSGLSTTSLCSIVQFEDIAIVADQVNPMIAYKYGETPYIVGINSPKDYKLIEDFESTTGWSVSNGTVTSNKLNQVYGTQCLVFLTNTGASMTASKTLPASLNLTVHTDTSSSSTSDYISFYLIRGVYASFSSCYLDLSTDTGFSNYYSIRLDTLSQWTGTSAPNVAFDFKLRKSSFTATGSPNWNNINAIRFRIVAVSGQQAQITVDFCRLEKTGPIPADGGSAGNLNGTYWYKVTYVTSDGWESDSSVMGGPITVANRNVSLTVIPVPGSPRIAQKKIYRLGGTSAEWRLLTILYSPSTTSYTDNIADTALGSIQEDVEGYPYIPKCICRHDKTMVIANLTGPDGTKYPCGIMRSQEGSIDIYDHLDFFEIEPNLGGEIKWIVSAMDFIYVGKNDSIWKFDPNDLSLPPRLVSRIYSGAGPHAVCVGENEFYFLDGGKQGIVSFNGSYAEIISDSSVARGTSVKNYIEAIPDDKLHLCWMIYHSQLLLIGIPQGSDTYPTLILAYYIPRRFWFTITGWNVRCGYSAKVNGVNTLHFGHATTGYVYNAFVGDSDDGTPITSIIHLGDDDYGFPESRKDFAKGVLWGKKLTTTNVSLTLEPYVDTIDSTIDVPLTIDSTTNKRIEFGIPQLGYKATYLGLRMSTTQRWSFRTLSLWARLEPPPMEEG